MFDKILIANRGEIAVRVMKTARRLGVRTVAIYSDADAQALHVRLADEAVRVGPAPVAQSYLNVQAVLEAARRTGAQAIHPGYGFLSENASFAAACQQADVVFIGPPGEAIRVMGSKAESKRVMSAAGVPLVPGYHGEAQDLDTLHREAGKIGYPVLVKASAGGGGKGMRVVRSAAELADAVAGARRESKTAFGDDRLLLEKYLTRPRHVEIQVFADTQGRCVYLFERDCSIQRRHQKVIEEAPAPDLPDAVRTRMGETAVAAAQAVGYVGAGTVEFLYEDGAFYFIEMNTRLQVEHPVTEKITGLDLVEWQLRVASGEPLPKSQERIERRGHAFEARIYAEDPQREFLPSTGTLIHLRSPREGPHVRVDAGVREGDEISVYYDPMIAKLITWDEDRAAALRRLRRALSAYEVAGVATNVPFLARIAAHPAFEAKQIDTGFIERHRADLAMSVEPVPDDILALAAVAVVLHRVADSRRRRDTNPDSPWNVVSGWRLNADNLYEVTLLDGAQRRDVRLHFRRDGYEAETADSRLVLTQVSFEGGVLSAAMNDVRVRAGVVFAERALNLLSEGRCWRLWLDDPMTRAEQQESGSGRLIAPMPGLVGAVLVAEGEVVERDQPLMIVEAMKMEHTIKAAIAGRVASIHFAVGQQVSDGDELLTIQSETAAEHS